MLNKLLYKYTAGLKCRLIARVPGERYLERYYIGELFGVTFYLHRFVSSDEELHVHNHPWTRSASFVLCGGYAEEVAVDMCPGAGPSGCMTINRRVNWFNVIRGSTFHRITGADAGTWTLFCHGERARVQSTGRLKGWGFLRMNMFMNVDADCDPHLELTTVFTPYPPSKQLEWWHEAPYGRNAGRAPL